MRSGTRLSRLGGGGVPLLALCLLAPAAHSQQPSRWAVSLQQGSTDLRGELRIDSSSAGLTGTFLLQGQDTAWLPLDRLQLDPSGEIRFEVPAARHLVFRGHYSSGDMDGEALGAGGSYRWRATRLRPGQEYYSTPPRFLLHEMVIGSSDSAYRIPGIWLSAAEREGETPARLYERYAAVARRAGLDPLPRDSLAADALDRAMGLYHRSELREGVIAALTTIRKGLRSDTARAIFDHLFRDWGAWRVDLHDAALASAAAAAPGISWDDALPGLRSLGRLTAEAPAEAVPGALYRLRAHWLRDSLSRREDSLMLFRNDPASGLAVLRLVSGYADAEAWYYQVMQFLLTAAWLPGPEGPERLADLMNRVEWPDPGATIPDVMIHVYGYPEGSARFALPDSAALRLIEPRNVPARQWVDRRGVPALLASVHALRADFGAATTLKDHGESWRVVSPGRYAEESFNGFLEPRNVILLDPSYEPLFAVGSLLHEWLHIEHERRWRAGAGRPVARDSVLLLPELDPFLAEGLAEWETERLLEPYARRLPLLLLGEAEKRASLPFNNAHVLGYQLIRTLARLTHSPARVLAGLVASGSDPAAVGALVAPGRASVSGTAELVMPKREEHVLIPEIEFTIQDGAVLPAGTRILPP